jgi:hypothetical protein
MTSPTINEAFAAKRQELLLARRTQFGLAHGMSEPDFAPWKGFCTHRNIHKPGEPRCLFDLVAHYGDQYPTAFITGCPECGSSYCD